MSQQRGSAAERIFNALAIAGILSAFALGLTEARQAAAIRVGEERETRRAGISVVRVHVTNTSNEVLCPQIRIAARDRDDHDLEEVVAEPVEGDGRLGPGARIEYRADFTRLGERTYDEELKEFSAYIFERRRC